MSFVCYLDEGAAQDFLLSTTSVSQFFLAPVPTLSMSYILDGKIEPDETFALQLSSDRSLPNGPSVFFRDTLQGVIIDGDGKEKRSK